MGLQQMTLEWFLVNMPYLKTNSRYGKDTTAFCCLLFLSILGSYQMTIGQITRERHYLLVIQIWGLQINSGCYTDTAQTKLKPSDKMESVMVHSSEKLTVGFI